MRAGVLVLVCASLAFAPAPFPCTARRGPVQDDMTRMQGRWEVVEGWYNGTRDQQPSHTHVTLKGTHWVFLHNERVNSEWEITLDPNARPRAMDLRYGKDKTGPKIPAVYRFDGDTLRFVYAGGSARPTEADLDGKENWLLVMRRVR